ncbi:hypothetical protein [Paenibacillus sanguinis]|uniref:hypothetical protein n=1 Tax=Paenibacillus sanguinis TaxID=225906 RepID=UPI001969A922|nr:hypothetical protein [Paenibacillus sanguinis]
MTGRVYVIGSHDELCYATSKHSDWGFQYGGTIISNGDIYLDGRPKKAALNYFGHNHGSLVEIHGDCLHQARRSRNR